MVILYVFRVNIVNITRENAEQKRRWLEKTTPNCKVFNIWVMSWRSYILFFILYVVKMFHPRISYCFYAGNIKWEARWVCSLFPVVCA